MDNIAVAIDSPFTMKRNIKVCYAWDTSYQSNASLQRDRTIPPEMRLFGENFSYNTDVYSYGLVLEELAKKSWSSLEGVFGKSLLGKTKREMFRKTVKVDDNDEVHHNNLQNDYYEEVITPKVEKVTLNSTESSPSIKLFLRL